MTSDIIYRKYVKVRKKLQNIQFKVSTSDLNASYTLISLQAKGFLIDTRDPTNWKA